ncbi:MAG: RNA polymerase factor sigma-32 [Rickettsiales bacterium]|nr:RNA polymerase factor sigma-32 [Rickettsiales bacterium]
MTERRSDALALYYDAIRAHPVLSAQEERALAIRWRDHGDRRAADRLVLSNMRAVIKIAGEYAGQHASFADLVQEGSLGLMRGVERFDPDRGVRFLSYAGWWIRAFIRDHLLRTRSLVRLGTTQRQRTVYSRLGKAKAQVAREGLEGEQRMSRLIELIGVDRSTIESMDGRLSGYDVSLDAPLGNDSDSALRGDFIADPAEPADELLGEAQERRLEGTRLALAMAQLPAREQEILRRRHLADDPETLERLGQRLGVSRERVRQLEARALARVRSSIHEELAGETAGSLEVA